MRLVVIGNSHLAALKQAWDQYKNNFSDIELIFFGAPGKSLSFVEIQNGCLISKSDKTAEYFRFTSGGLDKIDCAEFDGVLFYGKLNIRLFATTFKTHTLGHSVNGNRLHISTGCLTQIVVDRLKEFKWLLMLREVTDLPIYFVPAPYPSRSCLNGQDSEWEFLKMNSDMLKMVSDSFINGSKLALRKFNTTFLPQPQETIEDFLFTQAHFTKDSVGLFGLLQDSISLHEDTDVTHMNMKYGLSILASVLPRIESEIHKNRTAGY